MGAEGMAGARIPQEVAAILPAIARETGCDDWLPMRGPLQRRDCRIHFLRSAGHTAPGLVLKIYCKDAVGKNLARNLHRKSGRLIAAATDEFTVPRPVLFLQEENALAMEFVEAPLAGSLLIKGFHSQRSREQVIRKAARWLRWFHDHFGVTREPFVAALYLSKLGKMRERVETLKPKALARDRFLAECLKQVEKAAGELDGRLMPHAVAHGDFTPFNLFIDGGRTIGFDYRANRRMTVYQDINRFLVYLDVYRLTPARAAELREYGCRRDDFEAFMDAYGADPAVLDGGMWLRLQFMEVTRRMTSLALPRSRMRNRLFCYMEMAYLRRGARHMLAALGNGASNG